MERAAGDLLAALHGPQRYIYIHFFCDVSEPPNGLAEALDTCFQYLQFLPFTPGEILTSLSFYTLYFSSLPQLLRQLSPGGLLAREDPGVLRAAAMGGIVPEELRHFPKSRLCPAERRAAVLAHIRLQPDYGL